MISGGLSTGLLGGRSSPGFCGMFAVWNIASLLAGDSVRVDRGSADCFSCVVSTSSREGAAKRSVGRGTVRRRDVVREEMAALIQRLLQRREMTDVSFDNSYVRCSRAAFHDLTIASARQ